MTKPRLSIKLLWQIFADFKDEPIVQNVPQFLNFVEVRRNALAGKYDHKKSTTKSNAQPAKRAK